MGIDFHILTLFPEMLSPYFEESILGRAKKEGRLRIFLHQLRDYAGDKHHKVDDRPYGGGSGMVMRADVLISAVRGIQAKHQVDKIFLLSPRGPLFSHSKARELSNLSSLLLICGRYEGVDQRAIDLVVDEEISIGDYVITGGELAAQVVVDAVSRLIPGVVGDFRGPLDESHVEGLLEYPQYTRPEVVEGLRVPEVLLTGNHQDISKWRKEESLKVTTKIRSDLLSKKKL